MPSNAATIPTPPRLTGNPKVDAQILTSWAYDLYKAVVVEQQLPSRLNAIADIAPLTITISASPTQDEVTALRDTINAIITAAAPGASDA